MPSILVVWSKNDDRIGIGRFFTMPSQDEAKGFGADDYIAFDLGDVSDNEPAEEPKKKFAAVDDAVREHASARSTPWAVNIEWHRYRNVAEMYVNRSPRLNAEVRTYAQWICPTKEEHECRIMVIELLQRALCSEWPDADVRSFGSQDTQLYLPQGYVVF